MKDFFVETVKSLREIIAVFFIGLYYNLKKYYKKIVFISSNGLMKVEIKYVNSKEAEKKLKISSCELMHLRTQGKLKYIKKGNAFLYSTNDIEKIEKN